MNRIGLLIGAILLVAVSFAIGRTAGHDSGQVAGFKTGYHEGERIAQEIAYYDGYSKGYQDNRYHDHGCDSPKAVGDVVECHRIPMDLGKNRDGYPPKKVKVDQDLFDRWVHARDDKDEPSTGMNCKINELSEVDDCTFPAG